jgi:hypothetical protein
MFICFDCGRIFGEDEVGSRTESRGEFWGASSYEDVDECPFCGSGHFEEARICAVCGEYESINDMVGEEVCLGCFKERTNTFKKCYDLTFDEKKPIKVAQIITELLDEGDIEQILYEHILRRMPDIKCDDFAFKHKMWLSDVIAEEVEKNENGES